MWAHACGLPTGTTHELLSMKYYELPVTWQITSKCGKSPMSTSRRQKQLYQNNTHTLDAALYASKCGWPNNLYKHAHSVLPHQAEQGNNPVQWIWMVFLQDIRGCMYCELDKLWIDRISLIAFQNECMYSWFYHTLDGINCVPQKWEKTVKMVKYSTSLSLERSLLLQSNIIGFPQQHWLS